MPRIATLIRNTLNPKHTISLTTLRRQAAKRGWTIEIDRIGRDIGYWLVGTGWEDENFCSSKEELQYKIHNY